MIQTLDSYIYTGASFSTFVFDEVSLLCVKYSLSRFRKKKYYSLIKKKVMDSHYVINDERTINYFIHTILLSLSNATLILTTDKKKMRLANKYLDREGLFAPLFKVVDLSNEITSQNVCFVLRSRNDIRKYQHLFDRFKNKNTIILEEIINEINDKTNSETIYDEIRLKILQDNNSEIFFINMDIFSNFVSDFVYSLNKISIII